VSGRTAVQIRRYGRSFLILVGLIVLGVACGFYILLQERLPNPFQTFYEVRGAFPTAAAVVPGLGEPVLVSGVHVGEITNTYLHDGQGIIEMEIQPGKLPRLYRNAHAQLIPNTPLDDMEVDIQPGTPSAGVLPHGGTIPVGETTSPTQSDELLDALDSDTRTWLSSLIAELAEGTRGRGPDIRALLRTLGPTAAQTRQLTDLLAERRSELARLVHNLGILTSAASARDQQITEAIRAGRQAIGAVASQDAALRASVRRLPATLRLTDRTLGDATAFARALAPTATALVPVVRRLPSTLRDTSTAVRGIALLPLGQIRSFENATAPLAAQLTPIQRLLGESLPSLIDSFKVLTYGVNELAYDPGGRNPGFLYWLSWFAHNSDSFLSSSDGNGPVWRALLLSDCRSLSSFSFGPLINLLLGSPFDCTTKAAG
jgi:phospholipid/cholesterol/gamma-HCH transport system substrate-binding protein